MHTTERFGVSRAVGVEREVTEVKSGRQSTDQGRPQKPR